MVGIGTWYAMFNVIYDYLYSGTPAGKFAIAEKSAAAVEMAIAGYRGMNIELMSPQSRMEVRGILQAQLATLDVAGAAANDARSTAMSELSNDNYSNIRLQSPALLEKIQTLSTTINGILAQI